MSIVEWIAQNKEWLFSGVGVSGLVLAAYIVKAKVGENRREQARLNLSNSIATKTEDSHFLPEKTIYDLERLFDDLSSRKIASLQIDELNRLGREAKILAEGIVREVRYYEYDGYIAMHVDLATEPQGDTTPKASFRFNLSERQTVVPVSIGDWVVVEGNILIEGFERSINLVNSKLVYLKKSGPKFPYDILQPKQNQ
jgi:hypothetical protein